MALRGIDTEHARDSKNTFKVKQPTLSSTERWFQNKKWHKVLDYKTTMDKTQNLVINKKGN